MSLLRIFVVVGLLATAGNAGAWAQEARVRPAARVEMPRPVDSNSPAFWRNGQLVWFGSHGGPWASVGANQFGPWEARDVWIESKSRAPMWIESVWPDDGDTVWGWYHAEPTNLVPGSTLTAPRIGALISVDGGLTFDDLGTVLDSGDPLNPDAQNGYFMGGHGDFSVILDRERRYFYFFFDNYGGPEATQGVCVARMAFEDRANPEGKVWKYHNGSWSEAGRRGQVTPIFPVARTWAARNPDALWGPAVHWNTHLNCYVMLLNRAVGEPGWSQEGVYVSFSSDLTRPDSWSAPVKILDKAEFPGWYFFYPQVMGLEPGGTDRRAGRVARLYVGGISKWEIEFSAPAAAPGSLQVATFPTSGAVASGGSLSLSVAPTGSAPFTYQWFKDGVALPFGTGPTLDLINVTVADAGAYHVLVTNALGALLSNVVPIVVQAPALVLPPSPPPRPASYLSNLSVRAMLAEGGGISVGFVVQGGEPKSLLLRAVGPTLAAFGVGDAVLNPRLQVFNHAGEAIAANEDWQDVDAPWFAAVGAFSLAVGSGDAALALQTGLGGGTAVVQAEGPGVVLTEIYDPLPARDSKIVNLSARAVVGSGGQIVIGGFTVSGTGTKRVLVRAIGPELAAFGVTSVLARPMIEVYDAGGNQIAANAGWLAEHEVEFVAAGALSLPAGSADAAVVVTLPAGSSYSAVVRSADNTAGEALLELYELPDRAN